MNLFKPKRCLLLALVLAAMSSGASAGVFISVNFGPPALPVYEQPPCPAEGYIWTPGYWAWGPEGYYWVPGTWVLAPQPGYLWTPGYWGYTGGLYYWHPGYWGPVVGFYGGIPYGYGYTGAGYYGGYWRDNHFFYNQNVNNVNVTRVTNVYNTTVINNNTTTVNRVSYNGGPGGIVAAPTAAQQAAAQEKHIDATPAQLQHENAAKGNPQLRASVNQGRPPIAATAKPAEFTGSGVVAAKQAGAPYKAPENRPASSGGNNVARPATNVPRPNNPPAQTASGNPAPRNNVPRPPSSYQPATPSRGNQAAVGSAPNEGNVPRPQTAPRPATGASGQTPSRPQTASPSGSGRPAQNAARPESVPHPPSQPRAEEPHREQLR